MGRLKIKRFHNWYQIVNELGFSVAQFLSLSEAESYVFVQANNRGLGGVMKNVNQRRGYTMRRISKHP